MRGVKRKLSACADEENRLYRQVGARVQHLAELGQMHAFEDVKYEHWSRKRLDRLLVDYLMRQGYGDSAKALAQEKNIQDLVDIDTFEQMNRIRQSLLNQSVKEALDWCTENKKELRKMDVSDYILLSVRVSTCWLTSVSTEQPRVSTPISAIYRARSQPTRRQAPRCHHLCPQVPLPLQRGIPTRVWPGRNPASLPPRNRRLGT